VGVEVGYGECSMTVRRDEGSGVAEATLTEANALDDRSWAVSGDTPPLDGDGVVAALILVDRSEKVLVLSEWPSSCAMTAICRSILTPADARVLLICALD